MYISLTIPKLMPRTHTSPLRASSPVREGHALWGSTFRMILLRENEN